MRRFSQRNSLVTLNEINITPLLDLAFVLLIIFIITRPLLEQSMDLKLPKVGKMPVTANKIDPKDVWTVEIGPTGSMRLKGKPMDPGLIEKTLKDGFLRNQNMIVNIRASGSSAWDNVAKVMAICMRNGINRVSPQVAPEK
jgi:biopolymer transport protein ExbD